MQLISKIAGDSHYAGNGVATGIGSMAMASDEPAALYESESPFGHAFSQAAIASAIVGLDGRFLHVNAALCALLGYDEDELIDRHCSSITHPEDAGGSTAWFADFENGQTGAARLDKRCLHKSGREIHASLSISLARDPAENPLYFITHIQDETQRRRAAWLESDWRLALEMVAQDKPLPTVLHQLVRLVERQLPEMRACVMLIHDGTIRSFAPRLPRELTDAIGRRPFSFAAGLTCESPENAAGPLVAYVDTDSAWEGLRDEARQAGVECCWALTVRGNDGLALGLLIVFSPQRRLPDQAEREILETAMRLAGVGVEHHQTTRQLAHLVRHDALTGLPNRVLFEDRLHQAVASARRNNRPLGLLALDLNRFKHVNDTLGHQAGDSLLQQFSVRLRGKLRESDTLARVGGDEFLVILPDVTSREDAEIVAKRLIAALASAPFDVAGESLTATSSIGIAMFPVDADDTGPLQRAADTAMYRAKEEGRNSEAAVSVARSA